MTIHEFVTQPPTTLDKSAFVARYGGVYEHSPWIAEAAHDAGLTPGCDSAEGLSDTLRAIVEAADEEAKLALLRAHPDLAGRLAVAGNLTVESTSEQTGAGLDHCTAAEFEKFQRFNDAYKSKFDFPFILAVAGYQRADILDIFEARMENQRASEINQALVQVHRIALLRLIALSGDN